MRHPYVKWLEKGIRKGWCGPPVCPFHDGLPMTADEEEELSENDEICISVIRIYTSYEKKLVEQNHSPSVWRQFFT
jgi:hypothetical protein